MKNWKKLAALLLAGVMALAMLTACGTTSDAQVEEQMMNKFSRQRGTAIENDEELRNDALNALMAIGSDGKVSVDQAFQVNGKKLVTIANVKWNLSAVSGKVEVDAFKGIDDINFKWLPTTNIDIDIKLPYIKVGVAARTINGKTYVAVAIEYQNPIEMLN